ncbi:MAG: hypothetical protein C5B49_09205 [Bdellovibrio sp.]|nr:MAG: hypothetical protein C5B49_09205 [Bdellovibrio sp.]
MSASVGEGTGQDVDLNLAPIIDCFTVLITYLLVTASFLSLASVDVGVSATGSGDPPPPDAGPPPYIMSIEAKGTGFLSIHVRGGAKSEDVSFEVAATNGRWNTDQLNQRLGEIQNRWPTLQEVSVSADAEVVYKDIVQLIQSVKKTMPKVFISG